MKLTRSTLLFFAMLLATALCVASIGCAGLQTQHQKIGAACETIASGVEAATAAKQAGTISKADLQRVVDAATPTTKFCQPEPVSSLGPADYATLAGAALRIAAMPGAKAP